ncbi:oligosaccharide flippase family protein [Clostridium bowmanii]|uniref:oligosaccharide flippase family protein n=1 Tax=Clostridium bowmanii TaxID=132925 RepID=UPI001C0BCAAD|nr:oligosaccharide flippase family protein [Clostridium bowmanii]MBU3191207.1 oligosaccharide flippase family protein [Clostridium bowmanii]MCA1075655.1 oligosaccharide flippase family protein [Clostridium bowmanii]
MRTENSIKNTAYGLIGQLFSTVLGFVSRTLFIYILGANYLGVNGLFGNILSMLSLAELGVGSAITYSMYKPLAEKNKRKIKAIMGLYATAYRIIGCVVAILGLILLPFLNYLIKDKPNIPNLKIIYLLFLTNSVITYFFAYKSALIMADQKNYINTINQVRYTFVQNIIQMIVLLVTKNYLLYLGVQVIFSFLLNFSISRKADKMYPYLKHHKREYIDKETKRDIFKNTGAMMSHKVGGVIVSSTDNILISGFVGVYWVGLYSNYVMIIGMLNGILGQVFTALTASIGNLNAIESNEKSHEVFNILFFMNFWLYGFCSIALLVLFNPFIKMWIGYKYIMDDYVVIMIVLNFFVMGMRQTLLMYNTTLGLFWNYRFKPWFEALINLVISIILLKKFGIAGVFLGTLISTMTTSFWVEPYVLYKRGFQKPLRTFFIKYMCYTLVTLGAALITLLACSMFTTYTILSVAGRGVFCLIIPNVIFAGIYFKTKEFKHLQGIVEGIMHK